MCISVIILERIRDCVRVPYSADVIAKAEVEREATLAEKEAKAKNGEGNTGASAGQKPAAASGRTLPTW